MDAERDSTASVPPAKLQRKEEGEEILGDYVVTSLYNYLRSFQRKEVAYFANWVVGSKGVGKSTLLNQLHQSSLDEGIKSIFVNLQTDKDVVIPLEKNCKTAIFIDNIQVLQEKRHDYVRSFLKSDIRFFPEYFTVVSSSRHGLQTLLEENVFSFDDIILFHVLSPEERVGRLFFDKEFTGMTIEDSMKDRIVHESGGVPFVIREFHSHFHMRLGHDSDEKCFQNAVEDILERKMSILQNDTQSYARDDRFKKVYMSVLSAISLGKECNIVAFRGIAATQLPWTFLRSTSGMQCRVTAVKAVQAVNKLAERACFRYFRGIECGYMEKIQCAADMLSGMGTNALGRFFEMAIELCAPMCTSCFFYLYDVATGSVMKCVLELNGAVAVQYDGRDYRVGVKMEMENFPDQALWIYTPNAKGFDFVFVSKSREVHAIQASVQSWQMKCKKNSTFLSEDAPIKYLLTLNVPDSDSLREIGECPFLTAFRSGVRVIDPVSFFGNNIMKVLNDFRK